MFLVLAKQELVSHSGDVIAHDEVPGFCASGFFMRGRHRAGRIEVVDKKPFEATDRAISVFGDGGVVVDVLEEKTLQLCVALGKRIAETRKPAWGEANVLRGCGSGGKYALVRSLDEIRGELIEDESERCVEFQLFATGGVCGIDLSVRIGKNWRFLLQGIEVEKLSLTSVVEVRRVVCNFIHQIDELAFERRAKIEQVLGEIWEFRGGVIVRVLDDSFANLEGEIQAREIEIWTFELFDDAERLEIVIEARAVNAHELVQLMFTCVSERRMPDVMDESKSLDKVRVETEGRGNRASDLRNFQSVS